jgi:hypothetical protein
MTMTKSSSRAVPESIKLEDATCSICAELFTDPRLLPCLHTFCFQCLRDYYDSLDTRELRCPVCREPHRCNSANELDQLPTNVRALKLVDAALGHGGEIPQEGDERLAAIEGLM